MRIIRHTYIVGTKKLQIMKKIIVEVIKVDLETKKAYLAKEVFSRGLEAQTNNFDFPLISCLRLYVLRPACL